MGRCNNIAVMWSKQINIWTLGKPEEIVLNENHSPLIICQMGEVGSSSIYASPKAASIPNFLFFTDQLSEIGFRQKEAWLSFGKIKEIPDYLVYFKKLRNIIDINREKYDWKIITMKREHRPKKK